MGSHPQNFNLEHKLGDYSREYQENTEYLMSAHISGCFWRISLCFYIEIAHASSGNPLAAESEPS